MEEIGPTVVTFRFCIIMQGRTGACRVQPCVQRFHVLVAVGVGLPSSGVCYTFPVRQPATSAGTSGE
jgi:hypothetical protein